MIRKLKSGEYRLFSRKPDDLPAPAKGLVTIPPSAQYDGPQLWPIIVKL
jgi:hypothetical protein